MYLLLTLSRASLNKLAIRGIRSFDDKHVQVIEFYSPLTVIVGHNGSGKTTIIECLKYATTGDMPPNTKGGAFVHDPKMAGEKEVKAQVRLRFWNAKRERMTATRNLQVTTKKTGALTMKTLEGILAKNDVGDGDGKKNTISTRCSEMDEEVPYLMGVSKAILENVIFCHQEESNWPLSEPAALKKKFDDIFEATKYTKALDNIKTLRKERTQELKVDRERLKFLEVDKKKAERMRKELADSKRAEVDKADELERLKEDYERIKVRNANFYEEATQFRQIYEASKALKEKKRMYEENQRATEDNMQPMDESTEELIQMLDNFKSHLDELQDAKLRNEDEKDRVETEIEEMRAKERNCASKQGGFQAQRQAYESNLREREAVIRHVARNHGLTGYNNSPLEDWKVDEFVDKISEMVRGAEHDLKMMQADHGKKELKLQEELDQLSTTKAAATATKKSKQDQIYKLKDKVRTSRTTYDSVSNSVELNIQQSKLSEQQATLERLQTEIANAKFDDRLRDIQRTVKNKEIERESISGELAVLNRKADSRAKLDLQSREYRGKEEQVKQQMQLHEASFNNLIGSDINTISPEKIEATVISVMDRKERDLSKADLELSNLKNERAQATSTYNHAEADFHAREADLKRLIQEVDDAMVNNNGLLKLEEEPVYNDVVSKVRQKLIESSNRVMDLAGVDKFWDQLLSTVKSEKRCDACDRDIEPSDLKHVTSHMTKRLRALQGADRDSLENAQQTEDEWKDYLDRLLRVEPNDKRAEDLDSNIIPDLQGQMSAIQEKLNKISVQIEEVQDKVQGIKREIKELQSLKSAGMVINRLHNEALELQDAVGRLKRELESSGSMKTVDEVQKEIDAISYEIKQLSAEQQGLFREKEDKVERRREVQDDISRANVRIGELKSKEEKRKMEAEALKDMQENLVVLQQELEDLDRTVEAAEAPWKEKNDALTRFRIERSSKEKDASSDITVFRTSAGEIEGKHKACQDYLSQDNDTKMQENEATMTDIRRRIASANEKRVSLETLIQNVHENLSKSETLRSNINNNLRFREGTKRIDTVQEELDGLDLASAAKSRETFNKEYRPMLDEETNVQGRMSLSQGQLMEMAGNRKKLEKTLQMDYKSIDKEFKEQMIKTEVSEQANRDLEKYGKALDNAILKYHSIKMDEINDTISHLWSKTYQGPDIDSIRIVSDHDEASTSARKSYNYRVVMVKNEVELDMRGRCSAGQKVLASIIIRLALAESFGQGCGVLALDEPTTNLDQENINSLASALAEIIRERRQQANFQLIVITHDENFLQTLAQQDVVEYYWRVSRDAAQKSILERQRVGI
ncbi:DNA repair protein RAD50 [Cryptococcus wingfieldii CBS 7118]|uniref:DNA repair protein RAD50 n=1 Tax=Cryptococcus wingfieldii CBS 7118 TaxID=1295528 RepID=A0A1E3IY14_9TREE|nr:DNA repair protein RAD50 [Cryptococcus wingfieldii CBS 7118]ODN93462.1 DNA repair protein RAD50 [Cryptococcus wingfieldii CBS 7118]